MTTRLLAVLLVASACNSFPIGLRELPGTYVMNRGGAADTLILQAQGRYRRIYALPGAPVVVDSGAWNEETLHNQKYVKLTPFWLRSSGRSPTLMGDGWFAPLERTLSGRIQLGVDEFLQLAYVQRSRHGR